MLPPVFLAVKVAQRLACWADGWQQKERPVQESIPRGARTGKAPSGSHLPVRTCSNPVVQGLDGSSVVARCCRGLPCLPSVTSPLSRTSGMLPVTGPSNIFTPQEQRRSAAEPLTSHAGGVVATKSVRLGGPSWLASLEASAGRSWQPWQRGVVRRGDGPLQPSTWPLLAGTQAHWPPCFPRDGLDTPLKGHKMANFCHF